MFSIGADCELGSAWRFILLMCASGIGDALLWESMTYRER
jgi:hypothetical protein